MVGEGRWTFGVLDVDKVRGPMAFADVDLHSRSACAGIAAAAVEREAASSRLRHAAHVRENFERYFSPQLAERIAAIQPGIKRLYVSGYPADFVAQRGVLGEGVNFLQKPFSLQELAVKVREMLA